MHKTLDEYRVIGLKNAHKYPHSYKRSGYYSSKSDGYTKYSDTMRYCCSALCPLRNQRIPIEKMVKLKNMYFCSKECLEKVKKQ